MRSKRSKPTVSAQAQPAQPNYSFTVMAEDISWYLVESAFWVLVVAASCKHNLYWRVTSVSFCTTRAYYLGLLWLSNSGRRESFQPRSKCNAKWAVILGWIIFAIAAIWCCSLTPIHVYTPTFMDIWTSYADHPPLKSFDILYDAGEDAVVE
jgi:hypothetical protein